MTDTTPPRGPGDNRPPEPTPIERASELVAAADTWLTTVEAIADAEQAGRAQTFVDQLRANRADLADERKKEREPFDTEIAMIVVRYRQPDSLTGIALQKLLALLKPWLQLEEKRIEAEQVARKVEADRAAAEAERLRREAASSSSPVEAELAAREAAQAAKDAARIAARKPDRPQIKSDTSPRAMGLTTRWHARVIDEKAALKSYAKNETVRAACLEVATRLANQLARSAKSKDAAPPGFEFYTSESPT